MKILNITVDELPEGCDSCGLRDDLWCPVKCFALEEKDQQMFIGRPDGRHELCPLKTYAIN